MDHRGRPRVEGQAVAVCALRVRVGERRRACPWSRRSERSAASVGNGQRSSAHQAANGMPTSHSGNQPSQALLPRAAGHTSTTARPARASCGTTRNRRGSARSLTRSVGGRWRGRVRMRILRWSMAVSLAAGLLTGCDTIDGWRAHSDHARASPLEPAPA